MKLGSIEISLSQWLGSKWFTYMARLFMVIGVPALGALIWFGGGDARTRVAGVESTVADVRTYQTDRAKDSESFQTEVRGSITDLKSQVADVKNDVFLTKVDVGVIKRLVQELRTKQDVADVAPFKRGE